MGTIVEIKCKKCGIDKRFYVGSGRVDTGTENVVAFCKSCNDYRTITRENIKFTREEKNATLSKCECGAIPVVVYDTEMVADNVKNVKCRICGNDMDIEEVGLFD